MAAIILALAGEGGTFITPGWCVGTPHIETSTYGLQLPLDQTRSISLHFRPTAVRGGRKQTGHDIFFLVEKVEATEGEQSMLLWLAFLIAIHPFVRCHVKHGLTARRNSLILVIQCCLFLFNAPSSCITLQAMPV